jgi:hypothetical protein
MTYDIATDAVAREPEPSAGATGPPRRIVHPLALLGWPGAAVRPDRSSRPRRRLVLSRRERGR